jgi:hypothetical protein
MHGGAELALRRGGPHGHRGGVLFYQRRSFLHRREHVRLASSGGRSMLWLLFSRQLLQREQLRLPAEHGAMLVRRRLYQHGLLRCCHRAMQPKARRRDLVHVDQEPSVPEWRMQQRRLWRAHPSLNTRLYRGTRRLNLASRPRYAQLPGLLPDKRIVRYNEQCRPSLPIAIAVIERWVRLPRCAQWVVVAARQRRAPPSTRQWCVE